MLTKNSQSVPKNLYMLRNKTLTSNQQGSFLELNTRRSFAFELFGETDPDLIHVSKSVRANAIFSA